MERVPDFVGEEDQQKVESQTPFQGSDRVGASQRVILFKFSPETLKSHALGSNSAAPDPTMERGNQVAIQIALYFWRNTKAGRNCDYSFFKSLRGAGAIVQLPFDVPECPRPHTFGEFMDARINAQIAIITGSNPEWWNPACVRAEHPVPCFLLTVLPLPNGGHRWALVNNHNHHPPSLGDHPKTGQP